MWFHVKLCACALALFGLLAACSGTSTISSDNVCPDPNTYCEGNVLVSCRTDSTGLIPQPELSRTDCGAQNRVCIPDTDGARCR